MKKLIVDVYYYPPEDYRGYKVVGVLVDEWDSSTASEIISVVSSDKSFSSYVSGKFKERELPCINRLLSNLNPLIKRDIDTIIIDGYVDLCNGVEKIDTLGTALYESLSRCGYGHISVIGVAKSKYRDESYMRNCIEVMRGKESIIPLYVSSTGWIKPEEAAEKIKIMYGDYKLPDMIKLADKETKVGASGF